MSTNFIPPLNCCVQLISLAGVMESPRLTHAAIIYLPAELSILVLVLNTIISLDVLLVLWYCLLTNWSQQRSSSVLEDLVYLESLSLLAEYGANINHVAVTQVNHGNSKPARVTEVNVQSLMTLVKQRARHELLLAQSCHNLDGLP